MRPKTTEKGRLGVDLIYRTKEQQHYFNCPFQLGFPEGDSALKADTENIDIQEGDIILAATDGVLDNLFDEDILNVTAGELNESFEELDDQFISLNEQSWIQRLAAMIASEALRQSFNYKRESPFVQNARLSGVRDFSLGGKVDDITVVTGRILPN
jgi:protein phosphatase PTC7